MTAQLDDDTVALDAIARMDEQEYLRMRRFFDYCIRNIRDGYANAAAMLAWCGWHILLKAIDAELVRRGGQPCSRS